jgi:hypothetical protein
MTTSHVIHATAETGKMTITELADFVKAAQASGATGTEQVKITSTVGGRLKTIAATIDTQHGHDA